MRIKCNRYNGTVQSVGCVASRGFKYVACVGCSAPREALLVCIMPHNLTFLNFKEAEHDYCKNNNQWFYILLQFRQHSSTTGTKAVQHAAVAPSGTLPAQSSQMLMSMQLKDTSPAVPRAQHPSKDQGGAHERWRGNSTNKHSHMRKMRVRLLPTEEGVGAVR